MHSLQTAAQPTFQATLGPTQSLTERPTFPTALAAACAAVAASSATLLLALSPALLAPSSELAAQGLQLVELPRVVISAHREPVMDGTRVDAGRIQELPRMLITAQRELGGARLAASEGAAGQPVMQRRGF